MSKYDLLRFVLLTLFHLPTFAQTSDEYVQMANKAYDAGEKQKAKNLYLKAAVLHNPDAHFAIAYNFILTREERIYHFSEAAKRGHVAALEQTLEELFFRSSSLTVTDPQLAYDIYLQAKKANPQLEIFNEEAEISTLSKCIEAGYFDFKNFITRYNITAKDTNETYSIWELAEDASRGERFGPADPKLVLQLVCKGGDVPAEKINAVNETYAAWKANKVVKFYAYDYTSNSYGISYAIARGRKADSIHYAARLKKIAAHLKNNSGTLLKPTFNIAHIYIYNKTFTEQKRDEIGASQAREDAEIKQCNAYMDLIENVNSGYCPPADNNDADKELNKVYRSIMEILSKRPFVSGDFLESMLRTDQRDWIKYRDSSAKLFFKINPAISEARWKNYFTGIRLNELELQEKEIRGE